MAFELSAYCTCLSVFIWQLLIFCSRRTVTASSLLVGLFVLLITTVATKTLATACLHQAFLLRCKTGLL